MTEREDRIARAAHVAVQGATGKGVNLTEHLSSHLFQRARVNASIRLVQALRELWGSQDRRFWNLTCELEAWLNEQVNEQDGDDGQE